MKRFIVMGIPHHGNLGDNAIAVAEEQLLNRYFTEYKKYYMQEEFLDVCCQRAKRFIHEEDVILLHGGGNIGDTYVVPEKGRRKVIETFPNNKIIIFPQTAYFSDTEKGRKELEISKKIYNNHKHLVILAREKKSYDFIKQSFISAKVYLTPDIVMTLNKAADKPRKGALLLFRKDIEKTLNTQSVEQIKNIISKRFETCYISDMNFGDKILNNVAGEYRTHLLNEKFNEFQSSEIVITDRLHGMIFAAITQTPCIVFSSLTHKIVESYSWLNNLEYIQLCEDINFLDEKIDQVCSSKKLTYDNSFAIDGIVPILKKEILEN